MRTDIFEYILINSTKDLYREYGKDPFYSIVEVGESYENFKNTFQNSTYDPPPYESESDSTLDHLFDLESLIDINEISKTL